MSDREVRPEPSWPPPRDRLPRDREFPTMSGQPATASSRGREFPTTSWPPPDDREVDDREVHDREVHGGGTDGVRLVSLSSTANDDDLDDEPALPVWLSPLAEFRLVRDSPGNVAYHIDYSRRGAYSTRHDWRVANVIFSHTVGPIGILLCRTIEWAFFHRLSRCLAAIPIALALFWVLNHIPVTAWLIPDGWDFTTWWPFSHLAGDAVAPADDVPMPSGNEG